MADSIISKVVDSLKQVAGVKGLVLGGSRARGNHHSSSDIDIESIMIPVKDWI